MLRTMTFALLVCLGCKPTEPRASRPPALPSEATAGPNGRVSVRVDAEGYHPATIRAPAGGSLVLVFRRTTDESCGQQLRVPSMNLQRDLPLNTDVEVSVTVPQRGSLAFTCGMNMYQGFVVAL